MFVYIKSEPNLWTTGFYGLKGEWNPDDDYENKVDAANRIAYLNGSINGSINSEKKIAQAILDAQKMREESYMHPSEDGAPTCGGYSKEIEECLITVCKQQGLSDNLWALLNLTMHWWNDIQLWAKDVLADKNILDEYQNENVKMRAEEMEKGDIANTCKNCQTMCSSAKENHVCDNFVQTDIDNK